MRQTIMQRLNVLAISLLTTAVAFPQTPTPAPAAFDVASIKPAAPGQRGRMIRSMQGGRLSVNNMPIKELIQLAYKVQPFQIAGGPSWLGSDSWDIVAKPDSDPGPNQIPQMLQGLLSDRFGLKFHKETRELPVYALVAAKAGEKTPGLVEFKDENCTPLDPTKPPPPMPALGQQTAGKGPCGRIMMGINRLDASGQTIEQLASMLSRTLGRQVVDKSGLTARYDIHLEWTPDETQMGQMQLPPDMPKPTFDPSGPSIFTALQEQLGLKLESQKGQVEVFVIDHAEKPSDN
ncbi:MAG TPA: TIGR03435 family protein [Bryobacteraceae bacterium]|jgi:uncharacterized protein (TIGR03435 family)|nr:TIGR03435 family protein [Bryobacteraceae bacterium]